MTNDISLHCMGRCDGMGDLNPAGSYVRVVYRVPGVAEHYIRLSEGEAGLLAAELHGALGRAAPSTEGAGFNITKASHPALFEAEIDEHEARTALAAAERQPLEIHDSTFGKWVSIPHPGCDVVVIGVQKHQFVPLRVALPHQLYVDNLLGLLDEHEASEILVAPFRAADYVRINREFLAPSAGVTAPSEVDAK